MEIPTEKKSPFVIGTYKINKAINVFRKRLIKSGTRNGFGKCSSDNSAYWDIIDKFKWTLTYDKIMSDEDFMQINHMLLEMDSVKHTELINFMEHLAYDLQSIYTRDLDESCALQLVALGKTWYKKFEEEFRNHDDDNMIRYAKQGLQDIHIKLLFNSKYSIEQ